MVQQGMVNKGFDPSDDEESVLEVLKEENQANPLRIRNVTGLSKQRVNSSLNRLIGAGWVKKMNRGLYRFIEDPRTDPDD